jgi:hypothetical protein
VKPTRGRSDSATQRVSPDPTKTAPTNEHHSGASNQTQRPLREPVRPAARASEGAAEE